MTRAAQETGPTPSAATRSGATQTAAAQTAATLTAAAQAGAARPGATQTGATPSAAARSGATQTGATQTGATQAGAAGSGATQTGAARSGAAAGHHGHFHEAARFGSDAALLDLVLPFLAGGAEAGEPTFVALDDRLAALVRDAVPADSPVVFLTGDGTPLRPAAALRYWRALLTREAATGAGQVRILGEMPPRLFGDRWDPWARYESAINHVFADFPLWTLCAYDTRLAGDRVLADVARTHPRLAGPGDRHDPSAAYTDPHTFLRENRPPPPDPLQSRPPDADLVDPAPGPARQAVRAAGGGLRPEALDDLVVAVSETVTNALRYGRSPARLRVWGAPGRVVVTVTDAGDGPEDPFAGLVPAAESAAGGRGLWITHQSCAHVTTARDELGWTIRLVAE